ncbi:transporter substrate-binding domain-containing protein [Leeia sp. TBRC 13508]|uniref:Transporter substrate-binding domain-containing protein n=1 Tax=Leeia speluncae TaxID=2884804 RepID=A0ABS8D2W8_9NEIS|nr:transporter substrate-binding domain-containing protein [Leeia speluncae]MCB6182535.1 transporter substrate-binding domain-containing protein [Leeia speluncae]
MALLCFSPIAVWAAPPLQIAVDTENPPFMYASHGVAKGFYPDVIKHVFARMGSRVVITPLPWPRALASARAGKMGIAGLYRISERESWLDYSAPLFVERILVYHLTMKPIHFKSVADLNGLKVGVIRGWSYGDAFDQARKRGLFTAYELPSDELGMKALRARHVDVMLAIQQSAQIILDSTTDITAEPLPLAEFSTYVAFPKSMNMRELLTRFNLKLLDARKDGNFSAIAAHAIAEAK